MESSFTLNDLILFAFNDTLETDEDHCTENMAAKTDITKEWRCIFEYNPWKQKPCCNQIRTIMGNIIAYSMALQVFNTTSMGNVYKVMN
jgi:hypothetical protein